MKKKITIYFALMIIFITTSSLVYASGNFLISPSKIKADQPLISGNTYDLPVHTVYNNTSRDMDVAVSITSSTSDEELIPSPEWFEHTPLNQKVQAGSTGEFQSKIKIPDNASPGSYKAWFTFHSVPSQTVGIVNTLTLKVPFIFDVKDTETKLNKKQIILTVGSKTAIVDGTQITFDTPPYINQTTSRTMVPVRFVSETLGARVDWDSQTQQVRITKQETEIILTIDSTTAMINGSEEVIDSSPEIINSRTFVPLRFISEALGTNVKWDPDKQSISITSE